MRFKILNTKDRQGVIEYIENLNPEKEYTVDISPNHPDYSGTFLTPSGEKLQIAIWEKTSAKGTAYFSIAVSEPFAKTEQKPQTSRPYKPAPKPMPEPEDEGGDLPF